MMPWQLKWRHTLAGKLVLLFVAMAAVMIVTVGVTVSWAFRSHFHENIRPHLMQYLEYIETDIGTPPQYAKAKALAQRLAVQIQYRDRDEQWSTGGAVIDLDAIHYIRQFTQRGVEYGFGHYYDREYLISRHPDYTLVFSVPRRERSHWLQLVPVLVTLALLVLLYQATRRLFAPIAQIKNGIARIGSGELSHRIEVRRRDELGELGDSINAMADDIDHMLEAKRQLLLAISHELRSPLTRAKVAAAMLNDTTQQNEIQRDLNEMETLIEELLETERLSSQHQVLHKSATVLQSLIQELLEQHFANDKIDVEMPSEPITLSLDSARIKLLVKNILANALQHTPATAAAPKLTLGKTANAVHIIIRDHGPGIEPKHLPHLAEPFYRTDAARQRQTGGYGLGLYLCKVISAAHGGEMCISSEVGKGTTVRVSLPLS